VLFVASPRSPPPPRRSNNASGNDASISLGADWLPWAVLWFLPFVRLALDRPTARITGALWLSRGSARCGWSACSCCWTSCRFETHPNDHETFGYPPYRVRGPIWPMRRSIAGMPGCAFGSHLGRSPGGGLSSRTGLGMARPCDGTGAARTPGPGRGLAPSKATDR
jgi:hypothetical protein